MIVCCCIIFMAKRRVPFPIVTHDLFGGSKGLWFRWVWNKHIFWENPAFPVKCIRSLRGLKATIKGLCPYQWFPLLPVTIGHWVTCHWAVRFTRERESIKALVIRWVRIIFSPELYEYNNLEIKQPLWIVIRPFFFLQSADFRSVAEHRLGFGGHRIAQDESQKRCTQHVSYLLSE